MQTNRFSKYIGGLIIVAVVFLLGISVDREYNDREYKSPDNKSVQNQTQTAAASLMIDYGNGKVRAYTDLSVTDEATVFDLLKQAADENKIDLKYKDYGGELGVFIESIGGIGKDPAGKKWWQYWVNNRYSQVGVSAYKVQHGDVVEFKFIQGQE
jgi:hypothetical protein